MRPEGIRRKTDVTAKIQPNRAVFQQILETETMLDLLQFSSLTTNLKSHRSDWKQSQKHEGNSEGLGRETAAFITTKDCNTEHAAPTKG